MRAPFTQLYIHCVWTTWDRLPLITPEYESILHKSILCKCQEMHCEVLALGGDSDHIHLLIRISTAISVAELVKEIKGSTSHLLNHLEPDKGFFKWQGAYGAFTVSEKMLPTITAYITNQKKHHAENTIQTEIEQTFVVS